MGFRTERDSLGEVAIEEGRYWGAQTQRALENFRIGGERFGREMIAALGVVKKAAALTNVELGVLEEGVGSLIARAADEVIAGELDAHFPLVVWQTGSGTQTNMNANEVIANRANELAGKPLGDRSPVHPNDHVNASQSSNDVIPTALHVAVAQRIGAHLVPRLRSLRDAIADKAASYADVVKIGRTHLMDATPLTVGQELAAHAAQLDFALADIEQRRAGLYPLALGATAVGTGLNAPPGFGEKASARIAELTGLPFVSATNKHRAIASHEELVAMHGALRTLATALMKVADDLRWLGSGPRAGIGELVLPANEPGSSIMPGKVNPTQCEATMMVCAEVIGNDVTVAIAGGRGNFQLNTMKPLLGHALFRSITLLGDACASLDEHCVRGIEPNRARIAEHLASSLMLVTALAPRIGYDRAAKVAQKAHREGTTLREAAVALGFVSAEEFDALVRPETMVGKR